MSIILKDASDNTQILDVTGGGTGANTAIGARTNLGINAANIADLFTSTSWSLSNTSESLTYVNRTYTVSGSGVLWVTATINTDDTNTYGSTQSAIRHNDTIVARTQFRYPSAYSQAHAATASSAIKVSNGDTINIQLGSTRGGTKYYYIYFTCLGVTVSA